MKNSVPIKMTAKRRTPRAAADLRKVRQRSVQLRGTRHFKGPPKPQSSPPALPIRDVVCLGCFSLLLVTVLTFLRSGNSPGRHEPELSSGGGVTVVSHQNELAHDQTAVPSDGISIGPIKLAGNRRSAKSEPAVTEPAVTEPAVLQPAIYQPAIAGAREEVDSRENSPRRTSSSNDSPFTGRQPSELQPLDRVYLDRWGLDETRLRICSDAVFLRRVYVDVTGTLPTAEESRRFLGSLFGSSRGELIDALLDRPEFADYWAMKWCDILRVKAEFPIKLWPNAAQAYHRWVHHSLRDNLPFDQFASDLVTATGSNFRSPPANFYRAMQEKTPESMAAQVALVFLGSRLENWPSDRVENLTAFFRRVGYKPTREWKEEIVVHQPQQDPRFDPRSPTEFVLPDGQVIWVEPGADPRAALARWLVDDPESWFAKAVVNRVWRWLLGRGRIQPPDDIAFDDPRLDDPLLNELARGFVQSGYDFKQLLRTILNSALYQSLPQRGLAGASERQGGGFDGYTLRRMDAEVLIDAICQVTGTSESYSSIIPEPYTFLPDGHRAVQLPDGSITSSFLEMFGRPARDTGLHSERNNNLSAAQALHLLNSRHILEKIKRGRVLAEIFQLHQTAEKRCEELYLTYLSRFPTDDERAIAESLCNTQTGFQELAWALLNNEEFLFHH